MSEYLHKEYPKTVGRTEFWKQIKRTVNGREVSQEDISNIIFQIKKELELTYKDNLLDLGCGNGALASNFFKYLNKYVGVDFSDYLIEVANEFFWNKNCVFIKNSIQDYLDEIDTDDQINKVLIYGCASYLSREDLKVSLSKIHKKFNKLEKIFIGNIPNLKCAKQFFLQRNILEYDTEDNKSLIGIWWSTKGLSKLVNDIGYEARILYMPKSFYSYNYRFDILLKKIN